MLSSIIHFKLQKAKSFYRIPRGKTFEEKKSKIGQGFSLAEFLYFKYMFTVSESKRTQKLVIIISSACKQNLGASTI